MDRTENYGQPWQEPVVASCKGVKQEINSQQEMHKLVDDVYDDFMCEDFAMEAGDLAVFLSQQLRRFQVPYLVLAPGPVLLYLKSREKQAVKLAEEFASSQIYT